MYGNSAECKSTKNSRFDHKLMPVAIQIFHCSFKIRHLQHNLKLFYHNNKKHVLPIEPLTIKEMHFSALVISLSCMSGSWIF